MVNPRGYAFVAFARSYEVTLGYAWAATMKLLADFPTKSEWIRDCLYVYDSLVLDPENRATKNMVQYIIKNQRASVNSEFKGGYTTIGASQYLTYKAIGSPIPSDSDYFTGIGCIEPGYKEIEDNDDLAHKLRLIRPRLNEQEYEALLRYVVDGYDSFRDATNSMGLGKKEYDSIRHRIPYACKGLVLA